MSSLKILLLSVVLSQDTVAVSCPLSRYCCCQLSSLSQDTVAVSCPLSLKILLLSVVLSQDTVAVSCPLSRYCCCQLSSLKILLLTVALSQDRLAGLVVKTSASGAEDPGFESRLRWDFSGLSHTSDFKIGTPVANLPGPGVIGSALGLVSPVSAYCGWLR